MDRALPVVVMTAWGSVPLAVEAMHRGARISWKSPGIIRNCCYAATGTNAARHEDRRRIQ